MKLKSAFYAGLLCMLSSVLPLKAQSNDVVCSRLEPCSCPDWYDGAYIAPEIFYERVRISSHSHSISDFVGLPHSKTTHGVFYGANGGYIYKSTWGLYAQIDANYAVGKLKNHNVSTRLDHNFDVEGLLGFHLWICDFSMIPYIGIGYSYHRQKFVEETFMEDHLEMRYQVYYVPVGIRMSYLVTPNFEWGLNLKALPQADSTLKASIFKGIRWELAKTTGYFVEMPLTWNSYHSDYVWKFVLIPFWKMTQYGESQKSNRSLVLLTSPKQTYNDWGARLEAGTCF